MFFNKSVVKLVNTRDLKSLGFGFAGSSPAARTNSNIINKNNLLLIFYSYLRTFISPCKFFIFSSVIPL